MGDVILSKSPNKTNNVADKLIANTPQVNPETIKNGKHPWLSDS